MTEATVDNVTPAAADNVTPTPEPSPVPQDWRTSLPQDIREHPAMQKFDSPEKLAKSYTELEKMIGKNKLAIPDEKSSKEEWQMFYNKLGRPEAPDKYDFSTYKPKEGFEEHFQGPLIDGFKEQAHQLGMSQKQAENLYSWYLDNVTGVIEQQQNSAQEQQAQAEVKLRQEWQTNYDKNIELGKKAYKMFAAQEDLPQLAKYENDPAFIKMMANVGQKISESGMDTGGVTPSMTKEDALLEGKALQNKLLEMKGYEPEYNVLKQKVARLYEYAAS